MWRALQLQKPAATHAITQAAAKTTAHRVANTAARLFVAAKPARWPFVPARSFSASSGSDAASQSSAVALAPAPAPAAEPAAEEEEIAAQLDDPAHSVEPEPEAPRKVVHYRAFIATSEWQRIEDDHLLPPGLAIKMDFDTGDKFARIRQPEPPAAPAAAAASSEPATEARATDAAAAAAPAAAEASASSLDAPTDAASADGSDAASAPTSATAGKLPQHTQANTKAPKAARPRPGTRGFSTQAGGRAVVLPVFPTPSAEFLAARAPMPEFGKGRPVISVAPMVDVTDRHYRYLLRLISKHTLLYTPMIVDNALQRAPHAHALYTEHRAMEHPVVAQLGGNEAESMARAAKILEAQGFQAVNINVGCPAPSAIGHAYGACLMSDPTFPRVCRAMVDAVRVPVTVKCRIGLNKDESWEFFEAFIRRCYTEGGIRHFVIHARKALLNLKSAGKNLTVPPLNYSFVYRLKQAYPDCIIELNGGVDSLDAAAEHLAQGVDGVMFGRLAWKQPYVFSGVDQRFFGEKEPPLSRKEVAEKYLAYVEEEWERNQREIREFEEKNAAALAKARSEFPAEADAASAAAPEALPTPDPLVAAAVAADAAVSASSLPAGAKERTKASSAASETVPGLRHGQPMLSLVAPAPLDPRQLLRPIGYLYTHEPGYRRFRLLFEEGLLRHRDWSLRHIVERAMAAVEPPPLREWGTKDAGFEYCAQAKAEMDAARLALSQGGQAAAARAHAQGKKHALDFINSANGSNGAAASAAAAATAGDKADESLCAELAATSLKAADGETQCSAASAASAAP